VSFNPIHSLKFAVFLLTGLLAFTGCSDSGDPLKNAKPGDWARYNVSITVNAPTLWGSVRSDTINSEVLMEVISNDGKMMRLQTTATTTTFWKRHEEKHVMEIDLSKSSEEISRLMLEQSIQRGGAFSSGVSLTNVNIELGERTRDIVSVAGKNYNCVVLPSTITGLITGVAPFGGTANFTVLSKDWKSTVVPVTGTVRSESDMGIKLTIMGVGVTMTGTIIMTVDTFGRGGW